MFYQRENEKEFIIITVIIVTYLILLLLLLVPMALQPGVGLGLLQEFPPSFPVSGGYCPISTS